MFPATRHRKSSVGGSRQAPGRVRQSIHSTAPDPLTVHRASLRSEPADTTRTSSPTEANAQPVAACVWDDLDANTPVRETRTVRG